MRRATEPLSQGFSRATRRGGLVIRSGRAAHETTLAGFEGRPGARHLYGEVLCEAIEQLQREALDTPRPAARGPGRPLRAQRAPPDRRTGSIAAIDADPATDRRGRGAARRRASNRRSARRSTARDEVGLRALNDALKAAFDAPGTAGLANREATRPTGRQPKTSATIEEPHTSAARHERTPDQPSAAAQALCFKQSPVRLHPARSAPSRCSSTRRASRRDRRSRSRPTRASR